jgi:DNA-binding response OmpR family regulator
MKVLVVENNPQMLQQLCEILDKEGYTTISAENGEAGLQTWREQPPDFICLDIMMPGLSGYDVCREIRKADARIPIVFISSKSETADKVTGLDVGADDYIVKPFDVIEVVARIRAVARRCLAAQPDNAKKDAEIFYLDTLKVMPRELRAENDGKVIDLSLRDIKILRLFHDNRGKVVDRNILLDHCWGTHIMPESRTVDWHISQLRKKIEKDPANPQLIKTLHGAGYKFGEIADKGRAPA